MTASSERTAPRRSRTDAAPAPRGVSAPTRTRASRRKIWHWIQLPLFLLLAAVALLPLFWMVSTSLKTTLQTFQIPPALVFTPTFEHYRQVLSDRAITGALLNSLIIALSNTLLALMLGLPAAYALGRFQFKGRKHLWFWIISNRFISPIVVALPFFLLMRNVGLMDTHIGLILVYLTFNVPLVIWICLDQFRAVPQDLDEAAMVDGATVYQAFFRITLPVAKPGIAVAAILAFIFAWNEFLFALVLTRSAAVTAPVQAAQFMTGRGVEWGPMMATGTLIVLPVLLFAAIVSKHLVRGLTMGSVKG